MRELNCYKVNGATPVFMGLVASKNAGQSVSAHVSELITWEVHNVGPTTGISHSTSVSNTDFTIDTTGIWRIAGNVTCLPTDWTNSFVEININATAAYRFMTSGTNASLQNAISFDIPIYLTATDVVTFTIGSEDTPVDTAFDIRSLNESSPFPLETIVSFYYMGAKSLVSHPLSTRVIDAAYTDATNKSFSGVLLSRTTTSTSLTADTLTDVAWGEHLIGPTSHVSHTADDSTGIEVTINQTGVYEILFQGTIRSTSGAWTVCNSYLYLNGSSIRKSYNYQYGGGSYAIAAQVPLHHVATLNATDVIKVVVYYPTTTGVLEGKTGNIHRCTLLVRQVGL